MVTAPNEGSVGITVLPGQGIQHSGRYDPQEGRKFLRSPRALWQSWTPQASVPPGSVALHRPSASAPGPPGSFCSSCELATSASTLSVLQIW